MDQKAKNPRGKMSQFLTNIILWWGICLKRQDDYVEK
jgi:hypothetical protein